MGIIMTKCDALIKEMEKIITRALEQGNPKLPTEAELCERYQVSRQTVRKAFSVLEKNHLITRTQGSGTFATGLKPASHNNHIAILLPSDYEYTYPKMLKKIQTLLANVGFTYSFHATGYSVASERTILEQLLTTPICGLIVEPINSTLANPNIDLYNKLAAKGIVSVFLNGYYPNLPHSVYVKTDNIAGAYQLTTSLFSEGHHTIGAIFRQDDLAGTERYLGYLHAMRDYSGIIDDTHIGWFSSEMLSSLEKEQHTSFLRNFIQTKLVSCSSVICHNDEIAYYLIKELANKSLHVPADICIASFDNSYLCDFSTPSITSLGTKDDDLVSVAVDLLLAQLRHQTVTPIQLPYTLYKRNSTRNR